MPLDALSSYDTMMDEHGFIPADHARPQFFPVEALRVFDERGNELAGYKRIVRSDTGDTLHVATDAYRIVTNEDAFGVFEQALAESELDLDGMRIGTDFSNNGARCFRQYLLPAHRETIGLGEVALRLIMMNSYDGSLAFRGDAGFFNFVCANTSISGNALSSFRTRHAGDVDVPKLIAGLTKAAEAHVLEAARMRHWPAIDVSDRQAREVLETIPQPTKTLVDDLVHRWVRARDEDERQGGANAWCLYNVLTAWSTHGEPGSPKGRIGARFDREGRVRRLLDGSAWKKLVAA